MVDVSSSLSQGATKLKLMDVSDICLMNIDEPQKMKAWFSIHLHDALQKPLHLGTPDAEADDLRDLPQGHSLLMVLGL